MSKSVFSKIFSINDYNETHKIIYILGLKIKFPKSEYAKKQKANPYEYYKKNNIDITQIPPATGQIRDIQLANFELLKELDYVCKQNNLTYWIDFGTLLGAVRHKGFIPWDDDIDTGMLRPDYEKLFEVFDKTTRNRDITIKILTDNKNNTLLKVCHKKCSHLFVDIFPYDYAPDLETDEALKTTQNIRKLDRNDIAGANTFEEIENKVKEATVQLYTSDKTAIAYGLEYCHQYTNWFYSNSIIFPLKELEFEGYKFPVFNDYITYLERTFGDYMAYPPKFGMGHSMYLNLSTEENNTIKELLKE